MYIHISYYLKVLNLDTSEINIVICIVIVIGVFGRNLERSLIEKEERGRWVGYYW